MDVIQQVLGHSYAMFYCKQFDSKKLTPELTLMQCLNTVNNLLKQHGKNLHTWPANTVNSIAKLVRAHVIYQRLSAEPVRKPLLIHAQQNQFVVLCGDTRLMALTQLPTPSMVSVILTCTQDCTDQYQSWTRIRSTTDLAACTGLALDNHNVKITAAPAGADHAVSWIEFGDQTTAHHLHDVSQRVRMMQYYLDQQPEDFCFGSDWLLEKIKWTQ